MRVERRYLHDINLVNNRLLNPVINPVTTIQRIALSGLLTAGDEGYLAYDTNLSNFYFWDGSSWQQVGGTTSWGTITGTITSQTDLIAYLSGNYYPLSSNPAGYITSAALAPYLTTAVAASTYVPLTRNITINGVTQDLSSDRTWTITVPPGGVTAVTATAPLSSSGGATPDISIPKATTSVNGYLSSTDWTTFNSKEPAIAAGTTAQYWRGDKTWQTFPTIPTVTPSALTKTDDTNVTLTLGGTPSTALLQAVSLTLGWTGTLADSRIASAATWNAKQNAYTNLTTIGSLANAVGYLYNDGSGVFSYTSPSGAGTVTSVSAGTGMNFTTITGSGSVDIDSTKVPYFSGGLTGTPSASNFLRGDGAWATPTGGGGLLHGTAAGTDTYTTTITGPTVYNDGDAYLIRFTNGNTGTSTLNINSIGAVTLYRNNDGPLLGGDIVDGAEMLCVYDGTTNHFQVIGVAPNTLLGYVTNGESVAITKGQPVYAFSGTGDRMVVKLAYNTSDATSAQTVGLVMSSSIGAGQKGLIMMQGLLDGLSTLPTSTYNDGDAIYLGSTAGAITKTKPYAPNHLVYLGVVTTASAGAAGRMYVRVQNGYELDELHNVQATSPTVNDVLYYFGGTPGQWKTAPITTVLGYTPVNPTRNIGTTAPLAGGGDLSADRTLSITQATTSTDGYLSSTDWNTFNNKQPAGSYITALTGDVTATGPGSVTGTIANDAVTFAKMQNINTSKLLGRYSAGSGDIQEITISTGLSLDGSGNLTTSGTSQWTTTGSAVYYSAGNVLVGSSTDDGVNAFQVTGTSVFSQEIKETVTLSAQSASYTLALTDRGKLVTMNVGTANNLTVPLNSSIAFPTGTKIDVIQIGAGVTTILATGGVTLLSNNSALRLNGQYAACTLIKVATDTWYVIGNLVN